MSYDLYFRSPSDIEITLPALESYFRSRSHYEIERNQAWYRNEDTGVYFVFDLGAPEPSIVDSATPDSVAAFSLNYLRPHIFALEAEPEVTAFVSALGLVVDDPQAMDGGGYTPEAFVDRWNEGNEAMYGMIIREHGPSVAQHSLPHDVIDRSWRWNRNRATLQESLGESGFVPKIMFIDFEGGLRTAAVWPDLSPVVLPEVDLYCFYRVELATTKWFSSGPDLCYAMHDEVAPFLADRKKLDGGGALPPHWVMRSPGQPAEMESWVRGLRPPKRKPVTVDVDHVLEREAIGRAGGA